MVGEKMEILVYKKAANAYNPNLNFLAVSALILF